MNQTDLSAYRPGMTGAPVYCGWLGDDGFARVYAKGQSVSAVSADRCYNLYRLLLQAMLMPGEVWECGVHKGGTAAMLAELMRVCGVGSQKKLRLFDTFEGTETSANIASVQQHVGAAPFISYHTGRIPETFQGLPQEPVCFAHVNLGDYSAVLECCSVVFPRLSIGGIMLFNSYGFADCPGAKKAVDEYFSSVPIFPLTVYGHAIVFKNGPFSPKA